MANTVRIQTTYEVQHVIEPIYTNGGVALSHDGRILATCLEGDVVLTDLRSGGELTTIEGDGEIVTSLAINPSGAYIAICSRSLSMRVYELCANDDSDSLKAKLLWTAKPHDAPVISAVTDSTGSLLATGGADGVVKVWDIKRNFQTHTFHGHSGLVSALKFFQVTAVEQERSISKSSKSKKAIHDEHVDDTARWRLASGGEDGKVRVWNLKTRKSVALLDSHVSVVRRLDYSAEENALLSASRDKSVMVWDCKTWKNRMMLPTFEETETAGFLAQGTIIYTGGEHGALRLWEMDTTRELTVQQVPRSELEAIQDSINAPGLPFLLTVLADQTIVLTNIQDLAKPAVGTKLKPLDVLRRVNGNHGQIVDVAFVGAKSSCLALATNSEDIRIINLSQHADPASETFHDDYFGSEVGLLQGHTDIVIAMDVDWSGNWLATGGKDNTARLWTVDPETKRFLPYEVFTGHAESVSAVALLSVPPLDNVPQRLDPLSHPPPFLLTGAQDKMVKKWEVARPSKADQKSKARALFTRKAHDKDINALAVHHNGTLFASASQDRTVKIWSTEEGTTIGVLRGHRRGVWSVSFSPAGTQLSIVGSSGISAGRGYVLTGSGDKTVRIWSMTDYSCLLTLEGHTNSVLKVVWLPPPVDANAIPNDKRGPLVASAGSDTLVKIWEVNSGECATTLDNHNDRVWTLAVKSRSSEAPSEEGFSLVSGSGDGALTFWRDTTSASMEQARARQVVVVETDQRLDNLVYSKNYREAIVLALQLDQPARLLSLFRSVAETADFESSTDASFTGSIEVDDALASLADDQIYRLLLRCRDWSASARTALIAQRVLRTVVERIGLARLANLKPPRGAGLRGTPVPLSDILRGLRAYSERHFARVSDMWDESFMVEFTLQEMDALLSNDEPVLTNGLQNGHLTNGDVMVE